MTRNTTRTTGITSCLIVGLSVQTRGNRIANWALLAVLHGLLVLLTFVDWGAQTDTIRLALFIAGALVLWGARSFAGLRGRMPLSVVPEALETGAKYALAGGAAAASGGLVMWGDCNTA